MENRGWIKLHRKIQGNQLWTAESFTKAQAWIDLLLLANHKEEQVDIRGIWVTVKEGEVARGERFLAEKWRWSRDKVRRFLNYLDCAGQIRPQKNNVITVISICNWEQYQASNTTKPTANQTIDRTNTRSIENNKEEIFYTPFEQWGFALIWNKYPKKLGKAKSHSIFKKTVKSLEDFNNILLAVEKFISYHKAKNTEPQFIPHGSTWFKQWQDWVNYKEPVKNASNIA